MMKKIVHENEILLVLCEEKLVGVEAKSGDLTMFISPKFYKGSYCDLSDLKKELQQATSVNIMGTYLINYLIEIGYLHEEQILWLDSEVGKIGHAIVIRC